MVSFQRNMSTFDRFARAVVGTCLIFLGPMSELVTSDQISTFIMGAVGAIALISALLAYCFLYEMTGFCTLKKESQKS
jgi:hypothetical protein